MPKQPRNKTPRKSRRAPAQKNVRYPRLVQFPQARGRTVEMVELNVDSEFHCISIRFQDETVPRCLKRERWQGSESSERGFSFRACLMIVATLASPRGTDLFV